MWFFFHSPAPPLSANTLKPTFKRGFDRLLVMVGIAGITEEVIISIVLK
jgi:hypothetical protein